MQAFLCILLIIKVCLVTNILWKDENLDMDPGFFLYELLTFIIDKNEYENAKIMVGSEYRYLELNVYTQPLERGELGKGQPWQCLAGYKGLCFSK